MSEDFKLPNNCTNMAEVRIGVDQTDRELMELLERRFGYMRAAANQLFEPSGYIDSVLAPVEKPEKAEVDPPLDAADPHAEEEH